ncbi:hypothetical protein RFI_04164 [Reticulomyxa filosa]|uniref:Uncharacterized protein n=1 Tax=Reticulomyxa filosa TaxID=46433 RepID=X6P4E9_RETFI|nr:hypothetical protein RFI_04164 [Reticulomyxa filosa]|eukprot:ETO32944.1 hypothetical protein RFI_04164 [Reticulomyxa filosa]
MCTFLLLKLIKELKSLFYIVVTNEIRDDGKKLEDFKEKTMKPIQLNIVKNLRTWMKLYWEEDFANDEKSGQANTNGFEAIFLEYLLADTVQNGYKRYKKHGSKPCVQEDYWAVEIPKKFNFNILSPDELADQVTLMDFRIFSDGNENTKEVENLRGRKMVNFSKSQRMADRSKNIQIYQQHLYTEVQENEVVQRILLEEFSNLKNVFVFLFIIAIHWIFLK